MSKDKRPGGRTDDERHWPLTDTLHDVTPQKPWKDLYVITGGKK